MGVVTAPATQPLPLVAPDILLPRGEPEWGCFTGIPAVIDYTKLSGPHHRGRLQRFLRHKRWMYMFAATRDVVVIAAIVDAGPSGTGFVMITDRHGGGTLADASRPGGLGPLTSVNSHPAVGHRSHYLLPGTRMSIRGDDQELRLRATLHRLPYVPLVSSPWVELDLRLDTAAHPGVTAVSEIVQDSPMATATAKNAALPTSGSVVVRSGDGEKRVDLSGGLGGFDYTSGFLPRHTSWRWAFLCGTLPDGRSIGLNLVHDFTGIADRAVENTCWVAGTAEALDPRARITMSGDDPMAPWHVTTVDRAVDLVFTPLALHRENVNLGAIRSHFLQPTGHFSGTLRVAGKKVTVTDLPGVVEDQDVTW